MRGRWAKPATLGINTKAVTSAVDEYRAGASAPWHETEKLNASSSAEWVDSGQADDSSSLRWKKKGKMLWHESDDPWDRSRPADNAQNSEWPLGGFKEDSSRLAPWNEGKPADDRSRAFWGKLEKNNFGSFLVLYPDSVPSEQSFWIPWVKYSRTLAPGWGVVTPETPDPNAPGQQIIIPVKVRYNILNSAQVVKVGGGAINCTALSMSIDYTSWSWGFSMSVPADQQAALMPVAYNEPVELDIVIQGEPYRMVAESIKRERAFGSNQLVVSGRSLTAYLDSKYAPKKNFGNNVARTAQQLMNDVLTDNGVPIGWAIDWNVDDWLVPANTWSMRGTYIEGLVNIANSIGAYLIPDPLLKEIRVLPRYPQKPWDWSLDTFDIQLPTAVVQRESIEWYESPDYNAVYVSGTTSGVTAQVKRTGSAADKVAEMVTDPLITHVDAARQRGIAELGMSGAMANIVLSMPILSETGIILPGKMLKYVDGADALISLSRGVNVTAQWGSNGALVLRQSVEVEAHA